MTQTVAQYPFPATSPAQAVDFLHRVIEDRPMTKVQMPFGGECWVIHRHQAAKEMLENPKFVRGPFARGEQDTPYFVQFPDFLKSTIQFADPPDHTRLRKLVAKAFTVRRMNQLREGTERLAGELLDAMEVAGSPANLVSAYALQLSIRVLSEMIGVPLSDRDKFIEWGKATMATSGMTEEQVMASVTELYMYIAELVAARRAAPRDDLLSALAAAREADDSLDDGEILTMAMVIIVAGFDNTANFISQGVLALLRNPDQLAVLLADIDGVVPTAVEEILRHGFFAVGEDVVGSGGLPPFTATEDVEIDGVLIKKGESVLLDPASTNHDPSVFENSAAFDVTRQRNKHLTLSHGVHHCLGAPLARMEMQVALAALFRRFPGLRLEGDPQYASEYLTAGMSLLPVAW
jgi:cytochrome P450